jgi:hypothetical protein
VGQIAEEHDDRAGDAALAAGSVATGERSFLYSVYGLTAQSAIELPELAPGGGAPAIRVTVEDAGPDAVRGAPSTNVGPLGTVLRYPGVCSLVISSGNEISVRRSRGADPAAVRMLVLGPALAVLLHQRGVLALHASSVLLPAGVVGFLGGSGRGKSTLAAALQRRGHALVADDVTAVDAAAGSISVLPAFPQLKLWPEAAAALGLDPDSLPRVAAADEKRASRVGGRLPADRLGLAALYVVEDADTLDSVLLSAREALLELVRNSYCAPRLVELGARDHFVQCAEVARRVPVRRLLRPRALHRLAELARLVETDVADAG